MIKDNKYLFSFNFLCSRSITWSCVFFFTTFISFPTSAITIIIFTYKCHIQNNINSEIKQFSIYDFFTKILVKIAFLRWKIIKNGGDAIRIGIFTVRFLFTSHLFRQYKSVEYKLQFFGRGKSAIASRTSIWLVSHLLECEYFWRYNNIHTPSPTVLNRFW